MFFEFSKYFDKIFFGKNQMFFKKKLSYICISDHNRKTTKVFHEPADTLLHLPLSTASFATYRNTARVRNPIVGLFCRSILGDQVGLRSDN